MMAPRLVATLRTAGMGGRLPVAATPLRIGGVGAAHRVDGGEQALGGEVGNQATHVAVVGAGVDDGNGFAGGGGEPGRVFRLGGVAGAESVAGAGEDRVRAACDDDVDAPEPGREVEFVAVLLEVREEDDLVDAGGEEGIHGRLDGVDEVGVDPDRAGRGDLAEFGGGGADDADGLSGDVDQAGAGDAVGQSGGGLAVAGDQAGHAGSAGRWVTGGKTVGRNGARERHRHVG
jgi:hypothetical protein